MRYATIILALVALLSGGCATMGEPGASDTESKAADLFIQGLMTLPGLLLLR